MHLQCLITSSRLTIQAATHLESQDIKYFLPERIILSPEGEKKQLRRETATTPPIKYMGVYCITDYPCNLQDITIFQNRCDAFETRSKRTSLPSRARNSFFTRLRNLPNLGRGRLFSEVGEGLPHPIGDPRHTLHVEREWDGFVIRHKSVAENTSIPEIFNQTTLF